MFWSKVGPRLENGSLKGSVNHGEISRIHEVRGSWAGVCPASWCHFEPHPKHGAQNYHLHNASEQFIELLYSKYCPSTDVCLKRLSRWFYSSFTSGAFSNKMWAETGSSKQRLVHFE